MLKPALTDQLSSKNCRLVGISLTRTPLSNEKFTTPNLTKNSAQKQNEHISFSFKHYICVYFNSTRRPDIPMFPIDAF